MKLIIVDVSDVHECILLSTIWIRSLTIYLKSCSESSKLSQQLGENEYSRFT